MEKKEKGNAGSELKYKVLIIYDISEDKVRVNLAKFLSSFGVRVQNSAFEAKLNRKQFSKLVSGLERYVCSEDSIRVYRFYEDNEVITYGKGDGAVFDEVLIV